MPKTKGTKSIITISLDTEVLRRVDDLADAQGRTRSSILEMWAREKLNEDELAVKAFMNPVVVQALMQLFGNPDVLKSMAKTFGDDVDPQKMAAFQQGMKLMGNYSEAYAKGLPPEMVAKTAVMKTVAGNKVEQKKGKKR